MAKRTGTEGETRTVSKTGGEKGVKLERLDLVPPKPLLELARVYGMGAEKYSDTNYINGYEFRKSIGALERHVQLFKDGEDLDVESGLPHLAHASWHCFTLQVFQVEGLGEDDRLFKVFERARAGESV